MKLRQIQQALPVLLLSVAAFYPWGPVNAQRFELTESQELDLKVSTIQTVALRFPYPITSVDLGSKMLLARKAEGAQNILLIKAAADSIAPTSLIVLTSAGQLLSFRVSTHSSRVPTDILINAPKDGLPLGPAQMKGLNQAELDSELTVAEGAESNLKESKSIDNIKVTVDGAYLADNRLILRLRIDNRSLVSYPLSPIGFSLADSRQAKRTASQNRVLGSLYQKPSAAAVEPAQKVTVLSVLPAVNLRRGQHLAIELYSLLNQPRIRLQLSAKDLAKATKLPVQ